MIRNTSWRPQTLLSVSAVLCIVSALAAQTRADEPEEESLTAEQILERVEKTYATCKTYHDSGTVRTVYIHADGRRVKELHFTTAFVRPDRFRFEYQDENPMGKPTRYIVWASGDEVQTWWTVENEIKNQPSLSLALAGATGVSAGSAHTVPRLLLPDDVDGWCTTKLIDVKLIGEGKVGENECYRIEGKHPRVSRPRTLWIGREDYILRRIDEQKDIQDFRSETTTTYEPVINAEVTDEMLKFDPPEAK